MTPWKTSPFLGLKKGEVFGISPRLETTWTLHKFGVLE